MPSHLGSYIGAAGNREAKLIRAIDSVRSQTFDDWELIILADGCQRTYQIVTDYYGSDNRIDCILIAKQPTLDPAIRNVPIKHSAGEWITYLDSDDYLGSKHLEIINAGTESNPEAEWLFYNDYVPINGWTEQERQLKFTKCGTANITHRRSLGVEWKSSRYAHDDWTLIRDLMKFKHAIIPTPQYYICHIPNKFDV